MLLAELNIRHTRRHMPTRRVAVDHGYLPTSGAAFGGVLIGAVVAECVPGMDEEQVDALARLVDVAKRGNLTVPRIALRYRLQRDTHGLDLVLVEPGKALGDDRADQDAPERGAARGEVAVVDRDAPRRHVPARVPDVQLGEQHQLRLPSPAIRRAAGSGGVTAGTE